MLAKDRNFRQKDWKRLLEDLKAVMEGRDVAPFPSGAVSSMKSDYV